MREKIADASCKIEEEEKGIYFRAIYVGRDICKSSFNPVTKIIQQFAKGLMNIIYVIGDKKSKECMVIDICWDVDAVTKIVAKDGMKVVGGIITHNHFDHVGGKPPAPYDKFGISVPGIQKLAKEIPDFKVYIGKGDYDSFMNENRDLEKSCIPVVDGQFISLGSQTLEFIATPGHTPGSMSVLLNSSRLFSGDTLFYNSCGRVDMEGGDYKMMYNSLKRLSKLPDHVVVYTGHNYGRGRTIIEREKKVGMLQTLSFEQWKQHMADCNKPNES